jgi:hypothetical protein
MRRLIDLRVFPETWVLTPSFEERVVRLSYPLNQGCQSILVAQSPSFYPVQLSNVRAFVVKAESDVFELGTNFFPDSALAVRAIPNDFRSRDAYCRVAIDVEALPTETGQNSPQDAAQNTQLYQHSQLIAALRADVDVLEASTGSPQDAAQNTQLSQHSQQIATLQTAVNGLTAPIQWINADLGERWNQSAGWGPASYLKYQNVVHLRGGLVSKGIVDIFQLPTELRPPHTRTHLVMCLSASGTWQSGGISIGTDGWVRWVFGSGHYFSLDGVCFPV